MEYNIEIVLEKHDAFSTILHTKIREFNNEHSIYHRKVREKDAVQPINIVISEHNEQWIGGITAEVYWNAR